MATITELGDLSSMTKIAPRSNDWARAANVNLIKIAAGQSPGVISRTTTLPETAAEGAMYINPSTKKLCIWIDTFDDGTGSAGNCWYSMMPTKGTFAYVIDENTLVVWNGEANDWQLLIDFDAPHEYVRRELSFYVPGLVRPSATVFSYVAGMEFTIEEDAPDSGANCEIAPTTNVIFNILKGSSAIGTITFASGSTSGVIAVPVEIVVQPALPMETQYVHANILRITSPANVGGMNGLNVTLRGKIRAID